MKAGENKRAVTVGIFVAIGVVILVVGIMVLGGQQKRFIKSIRINTVFNDVGGLQVGNNVWFSGVKIGTVRKIQFYGTSQVEVTMNIEQDVQQYIRKDAQATISTDGLIGNKIVEIIGGSPRAQPVQEGDLLGAKEALDTDAMLETLQENNRNLLRVTTDVKNIVGEITKGRGVAGAMLKDDRMADRFRSTLANLESASVNAAKVSGSLSTFSAKLNNREGLANQLVSDTTVFHDLRVSSSRLRQASASAIDIADNVKQASNRLNSKNSAIGLLLNDESVNSDLKNTIHNLESSSEKLDENMKALQSNFLFRGYFRRKAKAKQKEAEAQKKAEEQKNVAASQPGETTQE
ncbi:MlaD family protein [Larkinella soli]|uniref:MlaD family protein n=1 Tax=Larkinella soli TaxID=1770527 RepID=UPI000FFC87C0|nr:MlaD family protein [Larkinella soli]